MHKFYDKHSNITCTLPTYVHTTSINPHIQYKCMCRRHDINLILDTDHKFSRINVSIYQRRSAPKNSAKDIRSSTIRDSNPAFTAREIAMFCSCCNACIRMSIALNSCLLQGGDQYGWEIFISSECQ